MSEQVSEDQTGSILIVDDDRAVRALIRVLLENAGYTVLEVASGEEAIETVAGQPGEIDLVILDLVMPTMTGETCLARLKEMTPEIRVLVTTGYSVNDETYQEISPKIEGIIPKPIRPPLLLTLVGRILHKE